MQILVDLFKIIKLELSEPLFDIRSGKAGNCQCSPSYEDPNGQSECSIENISAIRDVEFIRTNLARKSLKRPTPVNFTLVEFVNFMWPMRVKSLVTAVGFV